MNRDENARFHVDTNTSILTDDFIEELVESGMTDIGIDIEGLELETFIRITGIKDRSGRGIPTELFEDLQMLDRKIHGEGFHRN